MRYWLLTSTTYGTWLPGDERGSITSVRDFRPYDVHSARRIEHSQPGEAPEPYRPGLYRSALAELKSDPVRLDAQQAKTLLTQVRETCVFRGWRLLAVAVMRNHFHLVIGVADDPDPQKMLADLKAYGSRALNATFGRTRSGSWWTSGGSKRKLATEAALAAAINYVLHKQEHPLLTWTPE